MAQIQLNHKANTAGSNKAILILHLWGSSTVTFCFDRNHWIHSVNTDFKSLTNMSSGICQNEYPAIENDMDVGKNNTKQQQLRVKVSEPACMV